VTSYGHASLNTSDTPTTDFGFEKIPLQQKTARVRSVFDSVAPRYDVMNDLMSFGLHRLWKRMAITRANPQPGQKWLDLASGTGDLAKRLASKLGSTGQVWATDINAEMLKQGRSALNNAGFILPIVQCSAESLPWADNTFDGVMIGFGLRNVTNKQAALNEMQRVLRYGGRSIILEFSKADAWLAPFYDRYSFSILPKLGEKIAGDARSYQYLAESIRMHPDQETLAQMLREAGFSEVSYHNLNSGIVAIHRGYKC